MSTWGTVFPKQHTLKYRFNIQLKQTRYINMQLKFSTFSFALFTIAGHNAFAVEECQNVNLGYGFSETTHDPSLGDSHWGQNEDHMCYPSVHQLGTGESGFDDSVAVLVGGNFSGQKGAEIEGNMVVMGDFHVDQNGPMNFVSAGEGTQITPNEGGDCITVGGDMSSAKRLEVYFPHYKCRAVVKGRKNDANTIAPKWMTDMGFKYDQDSNLDMTKYEEQIDNLRAKSLYWDTLPTTRGARAGVSSQSFNIECSDDDVIQVFNVPASSLQGNGYSTYVFNENCSDKTILMNVQGKGSVTLTTKEMKWTKDGKVQSGGWANFPSCMNSAILWNFPNADNVIINGSDEMQGSLLVNGNLNFQTSGQSGRTMVLGNFVQNAWGSELHSFEFNPPKPLPGPECIETSRPTNPPVTPPLVDGETPPPTGSPTPKFEELGTDDDDDDDIVFVPPKECPEDVTLRQMSGRTDFPVDKSVVEIVRQDSTSVTVGLNQQWTGQAQSVNSIFYQYKESIWSDQCYEETNVNGDELFDTVTIACNIMSPYAYLQICVVDDEVLSEQDNATIPKCCHSEENVPPNTPTVCYSLEIRCESLCVEEEVQRSLRGSSKD